MSAIPTASTTPTVRSATARKRVGSSQRLSQQVTGLSSLGSSSASCGDTMRTQRQTPKLPRWQSFSVQRSQPSACRASARSAIARPKILGWNAGEKSSDVTWYHSFCTILVVYAVKTTTSDIWTPPKLDLTLAAADTETKDERFGVVQSHFYAETVEEKKTADEYKQHLRVVKFKDVGVPDAEGISFWKVPGGMPSDKCYAKSAAVPTCDVFLSHALKSDPNCPTHMMRTPTKYSVHKCVDIFIGSHSLTSRWVAEGKIQQSQAPDAMQNISFWCDTACVDHSDTAKKMKILKNHLEDFVQQSRYFMCLVSTQYFSRLWCFGSYSREVVVHIIYSFFVL